MNQAAVTHILPLTSIRRTRLLPVKGKVHVHPDQKVNAGDVIASCIHGKEHLMLDLRRVLNIHNPGQLETALQFKTGDRVKKDDVIAESRGLFRRVVRTPVDGQIVSTNAGQVLIQVEEHPVEILAGIAGTVVEIIPERGVVLETNGSLVQGVWGNGKTNQGMLLLPNAPVNEEINHQSLDVSMRGAVILGGWCRDAEIFKIGSDLQLRGLILGSMASDLTPTANQVDFPVILVDGFGAAPMNGRAFRIFESNQQQTACLQALPWNRYTGERPEVVIPLPSIGEPEVEFGEIKAGALVRVVNIPLNGKVGTVVDLPSTFLTLPNGLSTQAATVRMENNDLVSIPLANLDVLE